MLGTLCVSAARSLLPWSCARRPLTTPARDRYEVKVEPHCVRLRCVSWWVVLVPRQPAQQ
jgi:hypothetical protein